ncbi:MAG: argininosuccinate lyase [Candidatus Hydrogenedentes bacterium]|nr:argininosuccinate lyase [Candidatus Hydrogenedentota bacterium]
MSKLWGGRFEGKTDALVEALGESVSFDARLAPWDLRASTAHARMLGDCGIIPKGDAAKIIKGLKEIAGDIEAGRMTWSAALEDVHTNIEAALVGKIGEAGKRLHTARSRNDQIATDVRLWMRDQTDSITGLLRELRRALAVFAQDHMDVILPGFTHLQHAQPVLLAHHLLAYVEMFARDQERFAQMRGRINIMPLGSAALAGTPYPVNRKQVADELGFDGVSANSMDAVADRDSLIEFCANCSLVMMHLSRMSEEIILWSSQEFGFIEIGDAFTTGSSIMPQKKNPDVAELVRGKTARVYGDLTALLVLLKGLPLTYNRDLQEDKEPVFHASDTTQLCLAVFTAMVPTISVRREAVARALREGFMEATDLADYLVRRGVPFREAHSVIGRIVRRCIDLNTTLPELPLEEYRVFSPAFDGDLYQAISPEVIVSQRDNPGATAPRRVKAALRRVLKNLDK